MKTRAVLLITVCALSGRAQTGGTKLGIIDIQNAIIRTEEGQKTAKALQEKYAPRQSALEKQKRDLDDLQAQLNKGRNTMSDEARNKLIREIDQKSKALTRDNEDASAEFQQEEAKLINAIGQKVMVVIDKYAKEKGYSIILDISSPQSPVLWAVNGINVTDEIVALFDKGAGAGATSGESGPSSALPTSASPAVTKPPVVTRPPVTAPPKAPATRPTPK